MSLLYFPSTASSGAGGALTFISKSSASDSSSVSISSGIDSTYNIYKVVINAAVPATNHVDFRMQIRASSSDLNINSAFYRTYNAVSTGGSSTASVLEYRSLDQTTNNSPVTLTAQCAADGTKDGAMVAGQIYFYNFQDSNKFNSFRSEINHNSANSSTADIYIQTALVGAMTTVVTNPDELEFSFSSGNIASGDFILYGIKDS